MRAGEVKQRKNFVALQVKPFSWVDEGVDQVLDNLQQKGNVNTIFSYTFDYEETRLKKNGQTPLPDHGVEGGGLVGGAFYDYDAKYFSGTILKDFRSQDFGKFNVIAEVAHKAKTRGMDYFAWDYNNADPIMARSMTNFAEVAEIDVYGVGTTSPCFNHPEYRAFLTGKIESLLGGGRQAHPRLHGFVGAFFGPLRFQHVHPNIRGLIFLHALSSFLGCGIFRRPLDIKDGAALRQEGGELQALNTADLDVIGTDREGWCAAGATKLGKIIGKSIEDDPADPGGGSGAGGLRERGGAKRLEEDAVRAFFRRPLNDFQDLVALLDGVVIGVSDFEGEAEALSGFFGGGRLLLLIIVVVGREREEEFELGHRVISSVRPRSQGTRKFSRVAAKVVERCWNRERRGNCSFVHDTCAVCNLHAAGLSMLN